MWIVKLALRRPYTFAVMAIAILIAGFASFRQTPKDIFPEIDIPVISVIWTYNGLSVEEFERQITVYSEFALSANVNDVERIESQTLMGLGSSNCISIRARKWNVALLSRQQPVRRLCGVCHPGCSRPPFCITQRTRCRSSR